jgi:uncharacterized protein DUF6504
MRRIRGEPVEVWLRHGRPARFVWRGRLHTVVFVLDRRTAPAPPPAAPAAPGEPGQEIPGLEFWVVEATAQPAVAPTTYELCRDLSTGRWTLSRT